MLSSFSRKASNFWSAADGARFGGSADGKLPAKEAAATFRRDRHDLQRHQLSRLAKDLPLDQVRLPFVFRSDLGLDSLDMINDFGAVAWAVPALAANDVVTLHGSDDAPLRGPISVLGPGTGLGVALLVGDDARGWQVVETEGGHVSFAPLGDEEHTIARWMTAKFGRVSTERLLCGAGLFADGAGKIHCAVPKTGSADHRFKFGETITHLAVQKIAPAFDSVEVWGEGAASAKGADKAHWLSTDLSGVSAKASVAADGTVQTGKLGARPLRLREGALRSGEAVEAVAKAWATSLAARLLRGSIEVFAAPKVVPGDLVEITGLPDGHAAAGLLGQGRQLHVRGVRHVLDRQRGALTRLSF